MYKSSTYYTNVAAGKAFEFSGTFGGISISNADIMENSFQISEALTSDGSLTVGGIVTSQLKLTLNNFEGKFNNLTISEQTLITGTLTVTTNQSITLPTYHVVDWEKSEKVIHVTALDYTDFLNESLAGTLSGATWSAVVSAIAARYNLTVSTSTTASSRLSAASTELSYLNYSIETYKSVLLYIMQKCNLFARINSGTTLYIYYFDSTATPIPITNNMIADLDIEGPHSPTLVGIKPYTADSYEASGTAGYNLLLEGCPFYQTGTAASTILSQVSTLSFYNFTMHCIGDPSVQIGDYIKLDDNRKLPVLYKEYFLGQYMHLGFKWDIDSTAVFAQANEGGEILEQISDAETKATHYLSQDSTGVMVADLTDGPQTPSTATGRNVFIDSDSVDIRKGQTVLATFGQETAIYTDNGTELAHFGYASGEAQSGTATAPYYSLGNRILQYGVGNYSVAEGSDVIASGFCSHAEGYYTEAKGICSHASGYYAEAKGNYSAAQGYQAKARGLNSFSSGLSTVTDSAYQTVIGKYNNYDSYSTETEWNQLGDYAFVIGNGTSAGHSSNALTVDWNGEIEIDEQYGVWHSGSLPMSVTTLTNIGTAATSYTTGSWGTQGSITFQPGTYLIMVTGYFTSNATGRRVMLFASSDSGTDPIDGSVIDSRAAVNGVATRLKLQTVRTFSSATTYYLRAYQNSGSSLNFTASYEAIKIF